MDDGTARLDVNARGKLDDDWLACSWSDIRSGLLSLRVKAARVSEEGDEAMGADESAVERVVRSCV